MATPKNTLDDPLAYGDFYDADTVQKEAQQTRKPRLQHSQGGNDKNADLPSAASKSNSSNKPSGIMSSFFGKLQDVVNDIGAEIKQGFEGPREAHSHTHVGAQCVDGTHDTSKNRFASFAPERGGNDVKWYVDGCGYFWAVSLALESATESIWILDWWLSPELYLRRPPAKNEQYRLDRMLQAAARRGVKINVIVYKEVTQALTRKYLTPTLPAYLHSLLPRETDSVVSALSRLGLTATFASLEHVEAQNQLITCPLPVSSSHTKHALEDLDPNISVFRHPDHLPDAQTLQSSFVSSVKDKNPHCNAATISKLPEDALKAIFGVNNDVILYWAHHEKLLIVDGKIGFMGGLDMCFGRWDTNQHSIADAHPGSSNEIVIPGQDFNNARIADFSDVAHWDQNKVDRKEYSRIGWSDCSISLRGPSVEDLRAHFVDRWNFIYKEKYADVDRYASLSFTQNAAGAIIPGEASKNGQFSGVDASSLSNVTGALRNQAIEGMHRVEDQFLSSNQHYSQMHGNSQDGSAIPCQMVRSCTTWSNGTPTEHSVANAYISIIQNSQHFVYIENQFFITATSDAQKPVRNKIGAALVERILKAARAGQKFKVLVCIPAIPGFSGDLYEDSSLATRAIMRYQYDSINRGGHSIMEMVAKAGFDPLEYIRFYNLRNFDRIKSSPAPDVPSTVSQCYMLGGTDIRKVPWKDGDTSEMDAFVSEELYIHTKVIIADDQIALVGSANLNDRSQLGEHDSEIALIIEDPTTVDSKMNGQPWHAAKFAVTLRRQLMRKHLGLIKPQNFEKPDQNFEPVGVPNVYDFDSAEDKAVTDPLSEDFLNLWNSRAKQNSAAFRKVFHAIPDDSVRTWDDYRSFWENYFRQADEEAQGKINPEKRAKNKWGHVIKEEFSEGAKGVAEMKEMLSTIKGMIVEMPLHFLEEENIARDGLTLNALTEDVYT